MSELEQYIRSYFGISHEDMEKISSMFREVKVKKGDYFLKTGNLCSQLGFVRSGMMRMYMPVEGAEVTQWISTSGYFVTDLSSLVFRRPARWTIQALTDSELFVVNQEEYDKIGQFVPKWHELEKLFITRCFTMLEDRVFCHLAMSAEERYKFFFAQNKELFMHAPQQYLASMLGMTPETFSRIRKKLSGSEGEG